MCVCIHTHTQTYIYIYAFLIAQLVKNPPAIQETLVNSWVRTICWRRDRLPTPVFLGFPCGSAGKESTCDAGDLGSIPGLGKFPGEGKGYPLQDSGLENSMDCRVHGVTKSRTWLSDFQFPFTFIYIVWICIHVCEKKKSLEIFIHPFKKDTLCACHWPDIVVEDQTGPGSLCSALLTTQTLEFREWPVYQQVTGSVLCMRWCGEALYTTFMLFCIFQFIYFLPLYGMEEPI